MTEEKREAPAYVPWKTLMSATEQMEGKLPPKIDPSVFPTYSGGTTSQLLSAFRFLGFTEADGTVHSLFRSWVDEPDRRSQIMQGILTDKYSRQLELAKQSATPRQMQTLFSEMGVRGSTLQKAVRFFIQACRFADVPIPPTWVGARTPSSASSKGNASRKRRGSTKAEAKNQTGETDTQTMEDIIEVRLESGGTVVKLSVATSLTHLSQHDREWLFATIDQVRSYQPLEGPDEE